MLSRRCEPEAAPCTTICPCGVAGAQKNVSTSAAARATAVAVPRTKIEETLDDLDHPIPGRSRIPLFPLRYF